MGYGVSVEGNVVHVCEVSHSKWPRCLIFMPSGPVELLLILFEMANCICVVVSCISLVGRVLIIWSMCLLVLLVLYGVTFMNCLSKAFALSMSMMAALVPKQMLLFYCLSSFLLDSFAMVPTGCLDCVCDQFCQNVISRCLFCVHVFVLFV